MLNNHYVGNKFRITSIFCPWSTHNHKMPWVEIFPSILHWFSYPSVPPLSHMYHLRYSINSLLVYSFLWLVISFIPMSLISCDRNMLGVHQAFQYSLPGHFPVGPHDWVLNNGMWAIMACITHLNCQYHKTKSMDSWAARDIVGEK